MGEQIRDEINAPPRYDSQLRTRPALEAVNTGEHAGVSVIWDGIAFDTPVIPAKAGIHSMDSAFPKVCGVDSGFRGNDCRLQRPCLANDTSAERAIAWTLIMCS
jgi:hypothetical protein